MLRLLLLYLFVGSSLVAEGPGLPALFENNCVKCHGEEKQKGDLRLDKINWKQPHLEDLELLKEAMYQLEDGEMPPKKESKLSVEQSASFAKSLSKYIHTSRSTMASNDVVLRRLNKAQYQNVIQDLFGIDPVVRDLAAKLPPDELYHGFDNVGERLTLSDIHLRAYLDSAHQVYQELNSELPKEKQLDLLSSDYRLVGSSHILREDKSIDVLCSSFVNRRFKMATIIGPGYGGGTLEESGLYKFRVKARSLFTKDEEAVERLFDKKIKTKVNVELGEIPQLAFFIRRPSRAFSPRVEIHLKTLDIIDGPEKVYEFEAWLPKGAYSLGFNYENGLKADLVNISTRIINQVEPGSYLSRKEETELIRKGKGSRGDFNTKANLQRTEFFSKYKTPRIRISGIELIGPLVTEKAKEQFYHAHGRKELTLKENLLVFAKKAFRRELKENELDSILNKLVSIKDKDLAYKIGVKAILCSPKFLYLEESDEKLDSYEIANRLSFFLWNSMPDETLLKLAKHGELLKKDVFNSEVERMLRDSRSKNFVSKFVKNWLGFKSFEQMPPSKNLFLAYHEFSIERLMKYETYHMFEHILNNNLPIKEFFEANYTFINDRMAKHYGFDAIEGSHFRKVMVPSSHQRQGILGQSSVLVASANGVDTSPVLRGMWVLEHLLGSAPPLPPDDVEIPEPDTRGSLSLRDFYAKHRSDPNCSSCHVKIDPLGFALENFDAVGLWRETYEKGEAISAHGEFPSGEKFKTSKGMVDILTKNQIDKFAENLLRKLMMSSSGREINVMDDPEVEQILAELKKQAYPMRDMLMAVVESSVFRNK